MSPRVLAGRVQVALVMVLDGRHRPAARGHLGDELLRDSRLARSRTCRQGERRASVASCRSRAAHELVSASCGRIRSGQRARTDLEASASAIAPITSAETPCSCASLSKSAHATPPSAEMVRTASRSRASSAHGSGAGAVFGMAHGVPSSTSRRMHSTIAPAWAPLPSAGSETRQLARCIVVNIAEDCLPASPTRNERPASGRLVRAREPRAAKGAGPPSCVDIVQGSR
jgi:hypothetical protein